MLSVAGVAEDKRVVSVAVVPLSPEAPVWEGRVRPGQVGIGSLQRPVPVVWEGVKLDIGFRADLIVHQSVIVEVKSVTATHPVHKKQLLTYLRLADMRVGLLLNFNVELLKDGLTRVANGLDE